MQEWEHPLLRMLAERAAAGGGDLLEVGFGTGVSATQVQHSGVRSHTIIEVDDRAADRCEMWRRQWPGRDIRIERGKWQEVIGGLGRYDAVLYDVYPTDHRGFVRTLGSTAAVFAAEFFGHARAHLRCGGVLAYYTNEIDSLGRGHQRALLENFSSFTVELCRSLHPPSDCTYWWAPTMAVVIAHL
jgi:guanidinoacetate N-methyltransferase